MKKILSIITLFLFLEIFLFLTASKLFVYAADPVCPNGYLQEKIAWRQCSQLTGICCSKDGTGLLCDRTGFCNPFASDFCNCFQASLKDTKPVMAIGTTSPSCPPKFPISPLTCSEICCIPEYNNMFSCKTKPGSSGIPINCDWNKQNAIGWTAKNYCGNSGLLTYIAATKMCEPRAESLWVLKNTCNGGTTGIQTGIGCIPTGNLTDFLKFVLVYAFVASGGIILLLIISTGYTLITSSGNPEKLQGAQENIVALFSGLALIAFSLVLLQTIGADILNLKAFLP